MKLRAYQEIAATFIYENDFTAILAPVGAGKTALTLTAMSELLRDKIVNRFLVLAPKRVCTDVWPVEAPKWARNLQVAVASGTPAQRASAFAGGANVVVMAYDNLQWLCNDNPKLLQGFDGLVFDELTKLKNASGARANHQINSGLRWHGRHDRIGRAAKGFDDECNIFNPRAEVRRLTHVGYAEAPRACH
jgi:superfamily II DNA or RNA helicase